MSGIIRRNPLSYVPVMLLGVLLLAPVIGVPQAGPWRGIRVFANQAVALALLVLLLMKATWSGSGIKRFILKGPNLAVILLIGWAAFSFVLTTPSSGAGQGIALVEFLRLACGAAIYFTALFFCRSRGPLRLASLLILFAAIAVAGAGILSFSASRGYITGAFGNRQLLGAFLTGLLPVAVALTSSRATTVPGVMARAATLMLACALLMSSNRSSWLGSAIGLLVLTVLVSSTGMIRRISLRQMIAYGIIPLLLIALCLMLSGAGRTVIGRFNTLFNLSSDETLTLRLQTWRACSHMLMERPLTGWGIGSFPLMFGEFYERAHGDQTSYPVPSAEYVQKHGVGLSSMAHNEYLQLATELGLVGLALYLAVLGSFFYYGFRRLRRIAGGIHGWLLVAAMSGVAAQCVDAIFNPAWRFRDVSPLLWLLMGIGMAAARSSGQICVSGPQTASSAQSYPIWYRWLHPIRASLVSLKRSSQLRLRFTPSGNRARLTARGCPADLLLDSGKGPTHNPPHHRGASLQPGFFSSPRALSRIIAATTAGILVLAICVMSLTSTTMSGAMGLPPLAVVSDPSALFGFDVIAKTGAGLGEPVLTEIADYVSINDTGKVAFVGSVKAINPATGSVELRNNIYVGTQQNTYENATSATNNNLTGPQRFKYIYGPAQINNDSSLAAVEQRYDVNTDPRQRGPDQNAVTIWSKNPSDSNYRRYQVVSAPSKDWIYSSVSGNNWGGSDDPPVSAFGRVAFAVQRVQDGFTFLQTNATSGIANGSGHDGELLPAPGLLVHKGSLPLFPMIADNGRIVVKAGDEPVHRTDRNIFPSPIPFVNSVRLYDVTSGFDQSYYYKDWSYHYLAPDQAPVNFDGRDYALDSYFTLLGTEPGISDDGLIVAFSGILSPDGAAALNQQQAPMIHLTAGPGIFALISTRRGNTSTDRSGDTNNEGRVIVRIAGQSFNGEFDPGEVLGDRNGNGIFDADLKEDKGPLSKFIYTERISVNNAGTVVYTAVNNDGDKALFTSRLNVYAVTASVDPPMQVVKQRDTISGLRGTIQDIRLYDPINNRGDGDIAFWLRMSDPTATDPAEINQQAVVRARPRTWERPRPTQVPAPGTMQVPGYDWKMRVGVSDNDGVVVEDVSLGPRYMAQKLSVPYINLTVKSDDRVIVDNARVELTTNRLIDFQVRTEADKVAIVGTYAFHDIPAGTDNYLLVTQRYEFRKSELGDIGAPGFWGQNSITGFRNPISRFLPVVQYVFVGEQLPQRPHRPNRAYVNVVQRLHFRPDNIRYNSVSIFKDRVIAFVKDFPWVDLATIPLIQDPLPKEQKVNALLNDSQEGTLVTKAGDWDNYHQTSLWDSIDEPIPGVKPGCWECVHIHWRWASAASWPLFSGNPTFGWGDPLIPVGSAQAVEVGVSKFSEAEEDPPDFRDTILDEDAINRPFGNNKEDPVMWYASRSQGDHDAFFTHGGHFTLTQSLEEDATTPAPAGSLSATVSSQSQITLRWTDNSNNEGVFKIERRLGSTGTYMLVTVVGPNVTSYSDSGLDGGQYFYRVQAANLRGDSAYSNEASATIMSPGPVAPSGLVATAISSAQINLTWTDNSTNETGFKIERKPGASGTYAEIASVGANVTSYSNAGLSNSTIYYYRIKAYNAAGVSGYSNEASASLSNGDGEFAPSLTTYIGSGGSPSDRWFRVADVNGDGKADAVKYEPANGFVGVSLSIGDGRFTAPVNTYIGSGGSPSDRWFIVADVNGDGKADAVKYEPGNGLVGVWLSIGDGRFAAPVNTYVGTGGSPSDRWFIVADVNGDGKADAVRYEPRNGFVGVSLSIGDGRFAPPVDTYIGSGSLPSDRWFMVADVNGDHKADAIQYEPGNGFVGVSLSIGDGRFSPAVNTYIGSGGSPSDRWFIVADVNGDGKADAVKYEPGNGLVGVSLSIGDGRFAPAVNTYIGSGGSPADRWFIAADVNGDGKADAVKYEPRNGFVGVSVSTGDGRFGPTVNTYIGSGGSPSDRWFIVADVNGDKKADAVKYEPGNGYVGVSLSKGDGR